jgi:FAD synthetase
MIVVIFGTFDLLHDGHRDFIRQAKSIGDVTVVVGRDSNVLKYKGRLPKENEIERQRKVAALKDVDSAILGREDHDYIKTIAEIGPDVICLGYDQHSFRLEEELKAHGMNIKVIRLKPFESHRYKSSIIRKKD